MIYYACNPANIFLNPFWGGIGVGAAVPSNGPATVRGTPTKGNLTNSGTVTLPSAQPGDYMVVIIFCTNAAPPSTPSGWVLLGQQLTTTTGMYVYGIKNLTGSATFVSQNVTLGVYNAYALKQGNKQYDNSVSQGGTTGTPITAPGGQAFLGPDLLISAFGNFGVSPTIATPSSGTPIAQQTNTSMALVSAYQPVANPGMWPAVTAAVTGNSETVGFSIAIN